jgi:IS5 family transposase
MYCHQRSLLFRHLLEKHELAPPVLAIINAGLTQQGLMLLSRA